MYANGGVQGIDRWSGFFQLTPTYFPSNPQPPPKQPGRQSEKSQMRLRHVGISA